ncbi:uncharacterized protein LOC124167106 [Ischnura elegans]|uniref:uncharacterized protein LOC124167106 n=1 Tax=Ischnura elegans TaxID=197161 RepID=UPI001ED88832|nr:uncharacterized protein LOC124167106 [Ischnura elegans]
MGSPLSPVIANLFMEEFENSVLTSYKKKPTLWIRYVDGTFVIWPHGEQELENFLRHLNNQHDSIKFTMEVEKDGCLPFLDVLVTKKLNGKLGHGVYRKATHTDRYLHASSHHHPTQKAALISTLVHRAYSISDQLSLPAEKRHLVTALASNGYHSDMVLKRTAKIERKLKNKTPSPKTEKPKAAGYATIPYVAGTSEKIARLLKQFDPRFDPSRSEKKMEVKRKRNSRKLLNALHDEEARDDGREAHVASRRASPTGDESPA